LEIKARYTGERGGERHFYDGIPARDLSQSDYAALSDEQRRLVDSGVIYEVAPDELAPTGKRKGVR